MDTTPSMDEDEASLETEKIGMSSKQMIPNTTENEIIKVCEGVMDAVGTDEATPSILTDETEVTSMNDFDIPQTSKKRMECEIKLNEVPSTKKDTKKSINLPVETEIAINLLVTPSISNRKKRDQGATATAYPPSPTEIPPPIPIDRSMPPNYSYARSITPTPSDASSFAPSVATNDTAIIAGMANKNKKADIEVVFRDIIACFLDMAFDVIFLVYMFLNESFSWGEMPTKFDTFASMLLTVSIVGTILSRWMIIASLELKYRGTMRFNGCTVPTLSMYLVVLHHIPIIILTPIIDTEFLGGYSPYGVCSIGSSLFAMAISFHTTKCGSELYS